MKYIRFSFNQEEMFGMLEGELITRLDDDFLNNTFNLTEETYKLSNVEILPPIENPGKVVLIGLNYSEHAKERGKTVPDEPMFFMVSPTAISGHQDTIKLPSSQNQIDYEAELAIVIGKESRNVKKKDALSNIFGYTCANDISDRTLQKKDVQFTRAKSFSTFKPIGPVIETDLNPDDLKISLSLNGDIKQDSTTKDMIFNTSQIVEHVTKVMTLYPGDIILTGTPSGVGPLQSGDNVEVEIEGIGKLSNYVGLE